MSSATTVAPESASDRPSAISPRRSGLYLAALTLLIGLSATTLAWYYARTAEQTAARVQFELATNSIVNEITDRIDSHVHTLWGATGFLTVNPYPTKAEWSIFVRTMRLPERLPGTRAVGFVTRVAARDKDAHVQARRSQGEREYTIWPEGERDEYTPITLLEVLSDDRSAGALGFDTSTNPDRRAAMERARDRAGPALSGKITLVTDQRGEFPPGFILYLPVYRYGARIETLEERRAALVGFVYSPFRARDFILNRAAAQQNMPLHTAFEIYDGVTTNPSSLLFRSDNFPKTEIDPSSVFASTVAENVGGRTWTFRVVSLHSFVSDSHRQLPLVILLCGILISLLASLVVGVLAVNRGHVLAANERLRLDIEQRARVDAQLRYSEEKFRRLFNSIPLPTFAINRDALSYIEVNDAAVTRYGYSHEEFGAMSVSDVRPPEDVPRMRRFLESVRERETYGGETQHRLRDGTIIDVETMAHNIEIDGRKAMIVVAHDITERKRTEAALAEREQQLRQSQKLEAIGQLTGGIAHDFNNILTVITGTIDFLAEGVAQNSTLSTIVRLIDEAAARGADLTRDLLAFARRQPLDPQDTDVNALVLGVSKLLRSTVEEHVDIVPKLAANLAPAFVDQSQLTTSLLNLALNARDAMPDGGRIVIETANVTIGENAPNRDEEVKPGAYVMIAVSDNGAGIPADIRAKVFEPFFTTKDVGKGTGLGLSMVYGFIKQSGGDITLYSEVGHGTTIKLFLPRSETDVVEAAPLQPSVATGGNETIFVVEDDESVRTTVMGQLASLGYQTHVAANAAEAMEMVERGIAFDLLFTDVVMPGGMNGRALAAAVRARRPGVRVLFTSGYTEEAAVLTTGLDESASLLSKPYRRADLARKIRDALDVPVEQV